MSTPRWRVGHTGITWGIPADVEQALADVAAVGYRGFETFGSDLERQDLRPAMQRCGVPVVAAYCMGTFADPARTDADLASILRSAEALKALGGEVVVLGATNRATPENSPEDYRVMARTLDAIGRACAELGLVAAVHPHTGTPIETRDEIDRVLELTDPEVVFFGPDTGQIAKGGSDPVEVMRAYGGRIRHVHLKDWNGLGAHDDEDRSGYLNYEPIGSGVVDMPGIFEALDAAGYDGWINVELDGTPEAPRAPGDAAAMSHRYLHRLLGEL
jgi:inosose dehydratase